MAEEQLAAADAGAGGRVGDEALEVVPDQLLPLDLLLWGGWLGVGLEGGLVGADGRGLGPLHPLLLEVVSEALHVVELEAVEDLPLELAEVGLPEAGQPLLLRLLGQLALLLGEAAEGGALPPNVRDAHRGRSRGAPVHLPLDGPLLLAELGPEPDPVVPVGLEAALPVLGVPLPPAPLLVGLQHVLDEGQVLLDGEVLLLDGLAEPVLPLRLLLLLLGGLGAALALGLLVGQLTEGPAAGALLLPALAHPLSVGVPAGLAPLWGLLLAALVHALGVGVSTTLALLAGLPAPRRSHNLAMSLPLLLFSLLRRWPWPLRRRPTDPEAED